MKQNILVALLVVIIVNLLTATYVTAKAKSPQSKNQYQSQDEPQSSQNTTNNQADVSGEASSTYKKIQSLGWVFSPGTGKIGSEASIKLSSENAYLNAQDTNSFLKLTGNLPCERCYTLAAKDLSWFAIFSFDSSGYVKDDEKIDSNELLTALMESNRKSLEERKKSGLSAIILDGWYITPHYDSLTNRLEWGTKAHNEDGTPIVNYSIRLLGRSGVMSALLVSSPESLDIDLASFKHSLDDFSFNPGAKYAEFRDGDKVAEYGLAALVVGGAAAATAKGGLFKGIAAFGKLIIFGLFGAFAVAWNYVKGIFARKPKE